MPSGRAGRGLDASPLAQTAVAERIARVQSHASDQDARRKTAYSELGLWSPQYGEFQPNEILWSLRMLTACEQLSPQEKSGVWAEGPHRVTLPKEPVPLEYGCC
jgi:hypothetical protein